MNVLNTKHQWSDFPVLDTSSDLKSYIEGRKYGHKCYCHYTNLYVINSILENDEFWLSQINGVNDENDKRQFDNCAVNFAICFSTGVNENLPLWYLYSGGNGKGGRIRLTSAYIQKMLENAQYTLYETIDNKKTSMGHKLKPNEMTCTFNDIIYYHESNRNTVDLKYNTMTNYIFPVSEFETFRKEHNGFLKKLIWYYEKETRLLIRLNGEIADFVTEQSAKSKHYIISLSFDGQIKKQLHIEFAPEITDLSILDNPDYSAIRDFMFKTSNLSFSEYKGDIKMSKGG